MEFKPLTQEQYQKAISSGFSPDQIIENERKRKETSQTTATAPGGTQPVENWGTNFLSGGANKFATMGANVIDTLSQPVIDVARASGFAGAVGMKEPPKINVPAFNDFINKALPVKGTAGKAGEVFATTVPYIIPGMASSKVAATLDSVTAGLPALLGAATRVAGKALTEAATAGATSYLTTADKEQAKSTAMWTGGLSAVFNTAGEVARAYNIPEKLMRKFFKDNEIDIKKTLSSNWAAELKKSDPAKYADYVSKGLIKESSKGEIIINKSLAKKAMDAGIYGSPEGMGKKIYGNLKAYEDDVQRIAADSVDDVVIKDSKALHETLLQKSQELQAVAAKALELSAKLTPEGSVTSVVKGGTGTPYSGHVIPTSGVPKGSSVIDPQTALDLKRFLDGEIKYSKGGAVPTSTVQRNLEYWANEIRSKLASVEGKNAAGEVVKMGDVMKEYSDYMKMYQQVIDHLKRKGNIGLASELEMLTAGHVLATGNIGGALVPLAIGGGRMPSVVTGVAKFINSPTTTGGATTRAVMGEALSPSSRP